MIFFYSIDVPTFPIHSTIRLPIPPSPTMAALIYYTYSLLFVTKIRKIVAGRPTYIFMYVEQWDNQILRLWNIMRWHEPAFPNRHIHLNTKFVLGHFNCFIARFYHQTYASLSRVNSGQVHNTGTTPDAGTGARAWAHSDPWAGLTFR